MSESKVIVITGASRGIGLAIAQYLIAQNHRVFLVARSPDPMRELRVKFPGQVNFIYSDVSEYEVASAVICQALESFSRIDALIINHGQLDPIKRIADSTPYEWRAAYDVNLFSAVSFIQQAIPYLRKTKGRIILTSSGAATGSYATWGVYGSSKAALNHLAATLKVEEPDITTIAIRPGVVDTDMQAQVRENKHLMDAKDAEKFSSLHAEGKLLRPEQPGNVMARLALSAGQGLSGKFLNWNDEELAAYQDK